VSLVVPGTSDDGDGDKRRSSRSGLAMSTGDLRVFTPAETEAFLRVTRLNVDATPATPVAPLQPETPAATADSDDGDRRTSSSGGGGGGSGSVGTSGALSASALDTPLESVMLKGGDATPSPGVDPVS
jgi:hypothetical protein